MRTWLAVALAIPLLAAGGFAGWVFAQSEAVLHHRYPAPPEPILPRPDSGSVARGKHLVEIGGCAGCHGKDLRGAPFDDPGPFRQVNCANLTRRAQGWSDADFARLLHYGLTPKRESTEFMPSEGYVDLTDREVVDIAAFLRSLPVGGADLPVRVATWNARWQLATGAFPPGQVFVQKALKVHSRDLGPQYAEGRHLADIACTECHGSDLKGDPHGKPPNLTIVGSYDSDDFRTFMRTGKAAGGRELKMMSGVARGRFSHFTDDEVEALRTYLVARAKAETS